MAFGKINLMIFGIVLYRKGLRPYFHSFPVRFNSKSMTLRRLVRIIWGVGAFCGAILRFSSLLILSMGTLFVLTNQTGVA